MIVNDLPPSNTYDVGVQMAIYEKYEAVEHGQPFFVEGELYCKVDGVLFSFGLSPVVVINDLLDAELTEFIYAAYDFETTLTPPIRPEPAPDKPGAVIINPPAPPLVLVSPSAPPPATPDPTPTYPTGTDPPIWTPPPVVTPSPSSPGITLPGVSPPPIPDPSTPAPSNPVEVERPVTTSEKDITTLKETFANHSDTMVYFMLFEMDMIYTNVKVTDFGITATVYGRFSEYEIKIYSDSLSVEASNQFFTEFSHLEPYNRNP